MRNLTEGLKMKMQLEDIANYFPTGIASGDAFINRFEERERLKRAILAKQHTLLMAPRRYGKTSLLIRVAEEIGYPFCAMDLLPIHNEKSVTDIFVDTVGRLVMELLPPAQKAKETLLKIFKSMSPELTLSTLGQKLSLRMPDAPNNIANLFLHLDEVAVAFDKKAIVFIDEMQQIGFLETGRSIEALIRHAVERSKNITYCFSGSSRHLLKNMFGDSTRPLYRLCSMMEIGRISRDHYRPHLKNLAKERWGVAMSDELFDKLMQITEEHPFYINALCQNLWLEEHAPTIERIEIVWDRYVKDNRGIIVDEVLGLTLNQKNVLASLAHAPIKEVYSGETMVSLKLTPASVHRVIDSLLERDLIYSDKNEAYTLLDPAIRYYFLNHSRLRL